MVPPGDEARSARSGSVETGSNINAARFMSAGTNHPRYAPTRLLLRITMFRFFGRCQTVWTEYYLLLVIEVHQPWQISAAIVWSQSERLSFWLDTRRMVLGRSTRTDEKSDAVVVALCGVYKTKLIFGVQRL